MRIITDKTEIKDCHSQLIHSLNAINSEKKKVKLGYKGNSEAKTVHYSSELDMWWYLGKDSVANSSERYWNAFGIGEPVENRNTNIVCEINYPVKGSDNRIAAFWIKDGSDFLLVHSGKIGGGRKGIGKKGFFENYTGTFQEIDFNGVMKKFTVIGNVNDPNLPYQIRNFVFEVQRIKALLIQNDSQEKKKELLSKIKFKYNEEFSGIKNYPISNRTISATANHGLIVDHLWKKLGSKNLLVANDQQRDLFIYNSDERIECVFEVKTSLDSQTIFTAVGQLLLNNVRIMPRPKLVFVVPDKLGKNLTQSLNELGIYPLVYTLHKGKVKFKNLDDLL